MQMFRPISSEIFESMTNLVDFYVVVVHAFFAHDPQVGDWRLIRDNF